MNLVLYGTASAEESIEDMGLLFHWNSRTAVRDAQLDQLPMLVFYCAREHSNPIIALSAVFDRIINQVAESMLKSLFIGKYQGQAWGELFFDDQMRNRSPAASQ